MARTRVDHIAYAPRGLCREEACRYIGIGRSTLYVLIGEGEIEFIKLGSSTLLLTESLKNLIERRRTERELV